MNVSDYFAGLLRHRITIQRDTSSTVPDGSGGAKPTWADVVPTVYANVGPMSGRESVFAAQLQAVVSSRVVLRYRSGLDASMRILYRGRALNIRAVINVEERDRWLVLFCEEGVAT